MEWRLTHQQLIANDSKSPNVHLVTVASLLEQLGRAIKWSSANAELRLCIVKDRTQPEIRDHRLEFDFGKICRH